LALSRFQEAEVDARRTIELDRTYIKGYFRLATALKSTKQYADAMRICTIGLEIDPSNAALKKLKASCPQEQSFSRNIFGNLYKDKDKNNSSDRGGSTCDEDLPKSIDKSTPSSPAPHSFTPVESRILEYLQGLVSRLRDGEFGSSDANIHMLQGTFRKLVERETFADMLFPGVPADVLKGLPKNLKELFEWNEMKTFIALDVPNMTKSAAKILEGVRVRGEARGDIMDAATQTVLIPQIAQETFARAVVDIVKNLSKRASNINAQQLCLASPHTPQAALEQLDDNIFECLLKDECAVQDVFLGEDWANLVREDVIRYAKQEKMTDISFLPHVAPITRYGAQEDEYISSPADCDSIDDETGGNTPLHPQSTPTQNRRHHLSSSTSDAAVAALMQSDKARMAWIEPKDTVAMYPALAEAIRNLHSLPYEINGEEKGGGWGEYHSIFCINVCNCLC
jgi:hypothetical protein